MMQSISFGCERSTVRVIGGIPSRAYERQPMHVRAIAGRRIEVGVAALEHVGLADQLVPFLLVSLRRPARPWLRSRS